MTTTTKPGVLAVKRPHVNRFRFVAGQRAPVKLATKVEQIRPEPNQISGYVLTLECGHTVECVPHFAYTVGSSRCRCDECGRAIARDLPEFAGHDFSDAALAAFRGEQP